MACRDYKEMMMGYLDDELDDEQRKVFEEHLAGCSECSVELEDFRKLKKMTDEVNLIEPEDRIWQQYWSGVYNRIERGIGWIVFSVGAIMVLIYMGFKAIEEVVKDPTVSVIFKVGLVGLLIGLAILLVSLVRERLYFRK